MKCSKIERLIYLHTELDAQHKNQIDEHVSSCSACKELFEQVTAYQSLISKVAGVEVKLSAPGHLKSRIIGSIHTKQNSINFNWLLKSIWVQISMTAASILLAGFFIIELTTDHTHHKTHSVYATAGTTVLKTTEFRKAHVKRRTANTVSFYNCLKQSDCDYLRNLKIAKNL